MENIKTNIIDAIECSDEEIFNEENDLEADMLSREADEWIKSYNDECEKSESHNNNSNTNLKLDNMYYNYIQQIKHYRVLTPEETYELFKKYRETGSKDAREILICSNLRFVITVSKSFMGRGLDSMELIQEGNLGLIKAIEKFDYTLQNRFSTYAVWWIKQTIQRAIQNTARTIRVPIHIFDLNEKIKKVSKQLTAELNREPSYKEIAEQIKGVEEKDVIHAIESMREIISIETPVNNKKGDDSVKIGNFVASNDYNPAEALDIELRNEGINNILKSISWKEAEMLKDRYGIDNRQALSLEQLSEKYQLSKERIRQICKKSLKKLREEAQREGLDDFLKL